MDGIFGDGSVLNITSLPPNHPPSRIGLVKRRIMDFLWTGVAIPAKLFRKQTFTPSGPTVIVTGVEFAPNAQSKRQTVRATREVILAAGAIHTPQLLMLSGIGPTEQLESLGIQTLLDLPGVGNNLQDHMQVWCMYPYHNPYTTNPTAPNTDQAFVNASWNDYWTSRTGPFTSGAIAGVAFPSLPHITSYDIADELSSLAAHQHPPIYLAPDLPSPSTLLAGYSAQLSLLASALRDPQRAAYELINANDGDLTVASMRPLSRGTLRLTSPQPFTSPLIDPRYGSNPIDLLVLQAAINFNTRLIATESMALLLPEFSSPRANSTDEELLGYIRARGQTEYHPSGTAAMMPLEMGGVVDPELRVYGTGNLRVVDASMMPLVVAGHLQAVVYAVAEKVRLPSLFLALSPSACAFVVFRV